METQIWRKGDIVGDGRFEILKQLGRGGFGVTYLAYDNNKKRQIAIKTVNSDQQEKADFTKIQEKLWDEGFTLRGFPHRHIVRVYENVIIDGWLGFVMEYVLGQNLEKYVEANGRLIESEALRYIDQISQALDFVHQDNVFHRDVNPRNIMLRQDLQEAVLIDFGLAREFVNLEPIYLTNTHGSELYKPVEQYEKRGVFGPPSDIYALAVTLYYLLNGGRLGYGKSDWTAYMSISRKRNYESGKGEEADRELWAELINAGVTDKTLIAIQAGMAIEPEDRPKNMTKFRELLGLLPAATPPSKSPTLSFLEPLVTAETIQNSPEPPIIVMPATENPPPGLTASISTKAKPAQDSPKPVVTIPKQEGMLLGTASIPTKEKLTQDSLKPVMQPVVIIPRQERVLPGLTASISPSAKPTEALKKEEPRRSPVVQAKPSVSPQPKKSAPRPNQRPSKKPSPVSRRFVLQGLLGTGGIAGFGFVGLLLKNLFEPQPVSKPIAQSSTAITLQTIQFTTVKLNSQGKVMARPAATAQIYKEDLGSGVSLTMVKIPAGSFLMGSPADEEESQANEKPQHKVNLKSFYLGQTEVTQAQYQEIMGTNPSNFKGAELPVERVSWLDAKEFCKKLSQKTGKTYSLPSESQWEYACRAGATTLFTHGDTITADVANYNGSISYGKTPKGVYRKKTTAVNTFPPNAFGLFDMHGNVWEWCLDTWPSNYAGAPIDGSAWQSQKENDPHILRGGSWGDYPRNCRSAVRSVNSSSNHYGSYGFRVCVAVART